MAINGRAAEFSVCVAKNTYRYIIHGTGFNPEDTETFLGRGVTLLLDPAISPYFLTPLFYHLRGKGEPWGARPRSTFETPYSGRARRLLYGLTSSESPKYLNLNSNI